MSIVGGPRRRAIVIEEQYGLYRVLRDGQTLGSGLTLEKALVKATTGQAPEEHTFKAAELIEPLLGERVTDSELIVG